MMIWSLISSTTSAGSSASANASALSSEKVLRLRLRDAWALVCIDHFCETNAQRRLYCFSFFNILNILKDQKITKVKNVEKYKNNVIRKFHSRPIPRLFLRHNFLRPRLRLFFYTKFFETETKTFFKTRLFENVSSLDRSIYCCKRILKFYLILLASTFATSPFQVLTWERYWDFFQCVIRFRIWLAMYQDQSWD